MIPKFDDLINMDAEMSECVGRYGGITVAVSIPVGNRELFDKVNEEFHYRFAPDEEIDYGIEEINISVGATKFRYYLAEEEQENA